MPETSPAAGLAVKLNTVCGARTPLCSPLPASGLHFAFLLHKQLCWQSLQSFTKGFWPRLKWNRWETEASKERWDSFQELISPRADFPCPKAATRKHQQPLNCDRKTELPPLEDYSSIKLWGWDTFTRQEEHPFHPVEHKSLLLD